ncbi:MAG: hypothetical protein HOV80_18870 [Polyangiaceae bacterium]|nr:hypothetical protein [Polyangiaceae bacterium]
MRARFALALVFLGLGCSSKGHAEATSSQPAARETAPSASQNAARTEAPSAPAAPSVLPDWPALPAGKPGKPPAVTTYKRIKEPTLVIFFGTWCGGCVASVLSDAELAKQFSPKVRVGLALMADTDAKFGEFARGLEVPLAIDVWSDNPATRELKELCDIHGLPMSCLVDADHKVLWRGEPGSARKILTAMENGRIDQAVAASKEVVDIVDKARAAPDDKTLRARAVAAAAGLGGYENSVAWPLVEKGEALDLAVALARDSTIATGGLDFASLDTYAFGLWKLGHKEQAVAAAKRGMDVCDALKASCTEERGRYEELKAALKK